MLFQNNLSGVCISSQDPASSLEVNMPSFQEAFGYEPTVLQWVNHMIPSISHDQPTFEMPKQRVRNGEWIMYPVEVLHESSPKIFKIVSVIQEKGLKVIIDRRCLFAYDFMNGICVGSPQPAGIKCPCCNKTQEQVDLERESGRKDKIGTSPSEPEPDPDSMELFNEPDPKIPMEYFNAVKRGKMGLGELD